MNELAENYKFKDEEYEAHSKRLQDVMKHVLLTGTDQAHCFLDEGLLESRVKLFRENFLPGDPDARRIYAMKANPNNRVMKRVTEAGFDGYDCASAQEIERALSIDGMGPENIYFNNPVKRESHVQEALRLGVGYYTAQSRSGVARILDKNLFFESKNLEIAVRVKTPNPDARIDLSKKSGCLPNEAVRLIRRIKNAGVRAGLAMHTGSQNSNPQTFIESIKLLQEVARKSGGVSSMNIGGGFPINYLAQNQYDVSEYLRKISDTVQKVRGEIFRGNPGPNRIIVEPGRSIVGPAVDLAIPVLEINMGEDGRREIHMGDGIFTCFSDAVIHKWKYIFDVFSKDGYARSATHETSLLYGQSCDSGDSLGEADLPEDLQEGDWLWVKNAGAYMDSQSSNFHGFPPPKYVSYNAD